MGWESTERGLISTFLFSLENLKVTEVTSASIAQSISKFQTWAKFSNNAPSKSLLVMDLEYHGHWLSGGGKFGWAVILHYFSYLTWVSSLSSHHYEILWLRALLIPLTFYQWLSELKIIKHAHELSHKPLWSAFLSFSKIAIVSGLYLKYIICVHPSHKVRNLMCIYILTIMTVSLAIGRNSIKVKHHSRRLSNTLDIGSNERKERKQVQEDKIFTQILTS